MLHAGGVKPLAGIRVLDISRIVSGPTCAWVLAALGAEVIRVEVPGGDLTWNVPPFLGPDGPHRGPRGPRDVPLAPMRRGRSKRSVVIDVKRDEGRALLHRLAAVSDALVENFRPGATARMGIDYETLSALNPRLVYCSITGYGPDGPYRDRASMDLVVQAVSGLMAKTGFEDGPPTKVGVTIGDQVPALYAAIGILSALRQRDVDGRGQYVDVAMLDVLVALLWDEPLDDYEQRGVPERVGNTDPRGAPIGTFQTTDGWIAMVMTAETQWTQLCELMERPDLLTRWKDRRERGAQGAAVNAAVESWTRTVSTDVAIAGLTRIGVACGPVQSAWAARTDPQVAHRGMLENLRHPDLDEPGPFIGPRLPLKLSRGDMRTDPAEPLGASTDAVLRDLLELDDDELRRLHAAGVIESC